MPKLSSIAFALSFLLWIALECIAIRSGDTYGWNTPLPGAIEAACIGTGAGTILSLLAAVILAIRGR